MCSDRHKNYGCGLKKPKSTSSAVFGVETAAKGCKLKRCADRVPNQTDKDFSPELYRLNFFLPKLNFSPSTKNLRQMSILLNFFSHKQICFWLLFSLLVLLQPGSPYDFAPKTRDSAQGYIQCMPLHIGDPLLWTDGRTVMWLLLHYQNFLAS